MEKRNIVKNQKGFTLIEIIAVLVILGVLAAVAVPKYMNLTADAEAKAVNGALAAGLSTCSMGFAKLALSNSAAPDGAAVATYATANAPGGDYTISFAASATSNVLVTATKTSGTSTVTATKVWDSPES